MSDEKLQLPTDLFDPDAFRTSIEAGDSPISDCKQAIAHATDYLHGKFRAGSPARDLVRLRAVFFDAMLGALWDRRDWGDADLALSLIHI